MELLAQGCIEGSEREVGVCLLGHSQGAPIGIDDGEEVTQSAHPERTKLRTQGRLAQVY